MLMNSNIQFDLNAVYFLNRDTGFVVGDSSFLHGLMYNTTNGGNSWTAVNIPATQGLNDIIFIDDQTGFSVGGDGSILKTTDGGNSWNIKASGSTRDLSNISFPVHDTGYVVATGYNWEFLKTTDGGDTWNIIPIAPLSNLSSLEAVHFTDASTGFIGGWYLASFVKTSDGGNSWSNVNISNSGTGLYSIYFPSPGIGYAVGWNGTLYKTDDGGNNWNTQVSGTPNDLYSVYFMNDSTGIIVGSWGLILKTSNGGSITTNSMIQKAEEEHLSIFSGPYSNSLTIEFNNDKREAFELEVFDLIGNRVKRIGNIVSESFVVEKENLTPGIYIIELRSATKTYNEKVLIE
ncbi:MAG TPA: T9SS type A sorting domain-containing protein [Bacteroidetes bacterium]|nr:T9SS type A sorting domain-containing protein [Bacteroidota bacterium]